MLRLYSDARSAKQQKNYIFRSGKGNKNVAAYGLTGCFVDSQVVLWTHRLFCGLTSYFVDLPVVLWTYRLFCGLACCFVDSQVFCGLTCCFVDSRVVLQFRERFCNDLRIFNRLQEQIKFVCPPKMEAQWKYRSLNLFRRLARGTEINNADVTK